MLTLACANAGIKGDGLEVKNADADGSTDIFQISMVYCDEDKLIFKDYYGLFIYSLETDQIINSLDVKYIDCDIDQGDDPCICRTFDKGNIVALCRDNQEYYFDWDKNKLYTEYDISGHSQDKRDNLKTIERISELKLPNYSGIYADYKGHKLYLTYSDEEGILDNLSYVIEDDNGEIIHSRYIFRQ